jgi:hypothetical protein
MTGNLCFAAMILVAVTSLSASDSPWTGRWKYKREKSTFVNFAIWDLGNGSYRYGSQHGRTIMFYLFTCDGKPSGPLPKFYPFSCTGDPVHGWDFAQWMANSPMGHSRRTLSADGKTLTVEPPFDFNSTS